MANRIPLYVSLGLLMVVAILELSFISAMVGWLHSTASGTFTFAYNGSEHDLKGEPKNLIVDQGHTSNGAAGTAFVLVGLGGIIALFLRSRRNPPKISSVIYNFWLVINFLSLLLVLTALIYTFVVTNGHKGQKIDQSVAAELDGKKYPIESWAPQNWFSAVLDLDLVDSDVRSNIEKYLRIMRGWQYNLIPFFIVHLVETTLALWDALQTRQAPETSNTEHKPEV